MTTMIEGHLADGDGGGLSPAIGDRSSRSTRGKRWSGGPPRHRDFLFQGVLNHIEFSKDSSLARSRRRSTG